MSSKNNRYAYISLLRALAMAMVITPHLLAYRFETLAMRYLAFYVLNPLSIIQYCGALGVSIFFVTSGYLSVGQVGKKNYISRFYKSVIVMMVEVFFGIMFCWAFSETFERFVFSKAGYTSTYAVYTIRDWLESAVLYRNALYLESTDGVLWFLIPFIAFKILLLFFECLFRGNTKKCLAAFYILFGIGWVYLRYNWQIYIYTERFFYISIILIGYVFALLHRGEIDKRGFLVLQTANTACLLIGRVSTGVGIDEGYIVSAMYAGILFYVFWKMKEYIPHNRIIAYFDSIGLSFFLLHNCVGWVLIQWLYYVVFEESHVWPPILIGVALDMLVITLYNVLIQKPLDRILNWFSKKEPIMSKKPS